MGVGVGERMMRMNDSEHRNGTGMMSRLRRCGTLEQPVTVAHESHYGLERAKMPWLSAC